MTPRADRVPSIMKLKCAVLGFCAATAMGSSTAVLARDRILVSIDLGESALLDHRTNFEVPAGASPILSACRSGCEASVATPIERERSSYALMLGGLGAMGFVAHRRRGR